MLINKLRSGQASPEEKKELDDYWNWTQQDKTLFDALPDSEKESIRQSMLRLIRQRIAHEPLRRRRALPTISWPLRVAAALLMAVVAFAALYDRGDPVDIQTAYGQQQVVTLPDGTEVMLNGNSALRYDAGWDASDDREVWIRGEAFFDVTHTENHQKFIVHTEHDVDVQVLGTRFNVKVRRGNTEVMLEEGKVRLGMMTPGNRDTVTMRPGDLFTLHDAEILKRRVDPQRYAAWKENKLYFDETPLHEVARILEDTYGFEVVFGRRSLTNRKLSGEIQSARGEEILAAIRESLNIKVKEDGNRILLTD